MESTEQPDVLGLVGACLRATYTADNYDSLGDGITRSLLHLSSEEKTAPMRVRLTLGSASVVPPPLLPWTWTWGGRAS